MNNQLFLGGFQDIASGFYVTASQVPSAQANMLLARLQSGVSFIITLFGVAFLYIIPAIFIVKGLLSTIPGLDSLVNKFGGNGNMGGGMMGGGGSNGIIGYLGQNLMEFVVAIMFALNAGSGLWATEMGWFSTGMASAVQKIANSAWMSADTPASIAQFKGEVKVYSDKQLAEMYSSLLAKEGNMAQALTQYVSSNHPDANDMNFVKQKAEYTGIVARLQIISQKLTADSYAEKSGISDPNYYKQHLNASSATSNQDGVFNNSFISSGTAQKWQVSLPSSSN